MPSTLGSATPKAILPRKVYGLINMTFFSAVALEEGETVKFETDGTISIVTAATQRACGVVEVGNKGDVDKRVTVQTVYRSITRGQANGALQSGDLVCAVGTVTNAGGEKLTDYDEAVAGNWVVGEVITGGADNAEVLIGLFFNPFTLDSDT